MAEAFRRRLLGRFGRIVRRRLGLPADATPATYPELVSRTLSGKADGRPVRRSHGHACYLPTDEDGDGRIDHLTVWAADGFGPDEVSALTAVRDLEVGRLTGLRLALIGLGRSDDFRHRLFGESRTWVSATPFVVTRHLKGRGRRRDPAEWFGPAGRGEFVAAVAAEEWARRSAPCEPTGVSRRVLVRAEYIDADRVRAELGWRCRPVEFRRARSKPGDDGMVRPHGALRLTFDAPVAGPVSLGYACHFGLGLFVAAD